ncbi:MAG: endonuclease/exonuclease/phosphatase family protein [Bacteriovoracia bacterium]
MKMFFWIFLSILVFFVTFFLWASYPWSIGEKMVALPVLDVEPVDMIEIPEAPSVVKILTYNIGFLYGRGSEGPGYEFREKEFYEKALKRVSDEIKELGTEIVFLQEVDFEASRSHDINQARVIAKNAGYPYVAEAPSWESNYIPFPYWPLKNNFGRVLSGGAILSKYPLSDHEVVFLAKPLSQPWWYNFFYLHRYFQKATVHLGNKKFKLVNLHLEAFDKVDRKSQVEKLVEVIKQENVDIVGGDFNMLPPSASRRSKFYNDDNYEDDDSYQVMLTSGLQEVIPDEIYAKDEVKFFTFPSWSPDRRLDYIWYRRDLKMMKAEVIPSASSDHIPLRASFQIDGPRFNPYSL